MKIWSWEFGKKKKEIFPGRAHTKEERSAMKRSLSYYVVSTAIKRFIIFVFGS